MMGKVVGEEHIGHHELHRVTVGGFYIGYANPYKNITYRLNIFLSIRYKAHYTTAFYQCFSIPINIESMKVKYVL